MAYANDQKISLHETCWKYNGKNFRFDYEFVLPTNLKENNVLSNVWPIPYC